MISLPRGEIRIGLPAGTKRRRAAIARQKLAAGQQWRNHVSNSCGVHPKQVERERQFIKDFGLTDVQCSDVGDIAFSSRRGMKQYVKARGWANKDET